MVHVENGMLEDYKEMDWAKENVMWCKRSVDRTLEAVDDIYRYTKRWWKSLSDWLNN